MTQDSIRARLELESQLIAHRFDSIKLELDLPVEAALLSTWAKNRLKHGRDPAIAQPKLQELVDLLEGFLKTEEGLSHQHLPEVHSA